jgi:PAS domain S-box-containing protein
MSAFAFGVRPPSDDDARFLLSQQVIFGRQQVLGLGIISALLALLVALAFFDTSPWPVTAGWFVLVAVGIGIAVSGWRLRKKKGREPRDADRSARKFVRQAVTISILWGAAYWFTMPVENVGMQFLLIFCAAGAAAGTVTGFGPLPTVWGPMILITVLPPAIKQCVHAERIDLITCGGLLLFVAGVGFYGITAAQSYARLIRLQQTAEDLAEQKSRTEAALEHFFERTNALTAICDGDGVYRRVNPAWQQVLGYAPGEMIGRQSIDFIHPDDRDAAEHAALSTVEGQPVVNLVARMRARDGSYRWLQWNSVRDPRDGTILMSAADITDREDARIVKEKLVATVSHELRTPLTALQASLQIIGAGIAGPIPGSGERMLEIAERNAERLISLTDDILDLERIGVSRMNITEVEPAALIRNCVSELQAMLDSFGVKIAIDDRSGGARLLGDEVRLRQVLHNLLSNAIKFSPINGTVRIGATATADTVRITVADDGPGIPEGAEEKIFERFVQLPRPADRKIGGTGLGLAIARELVTAMKGRIAAEKVAHGAQFCFELPRAPDAGGREAAAPESVSV